MTHIPDHKIVEKYQFRPGQSGNPGGLTREVRAKMRENAERAMRIRGLFLQSLEKKLEAAIRDEDADAVKLLQSEINTFLRDSENRGFGTPTQSIQMSGPDGGPIESVTSSMTPEEAARIYQASLSGEADGSDEPSDD